jgi:CRISPR-associated protein Csd1
MILGALYELARTQQLNGDLDFQEEPIRFVLVLGPGGRTGRLLDRAEVVQAHPGSGKARSRVPGMAIPRQEKLTSGNKPQFLVNTAEYVFGVDLDGERDEAKLGIRVANFRADIQTLLAGVHEDAIASTAIQAIHGFLSLPVAERRRVLEEFLSAAPPGAERERMKEALGSAKFAIQYGPSLVHDLEAVRKYWTALRRPSSTARTIRCLVTGAIGVPATKHPRVKGVPNGNSSDTAVVSFNEPAFWSYGWERHANACIARDTAETCGNALNWLLQMKNRRRLNLSSDTAALFWANGNEDVGFLFALGDDPESVRAVLEAPHAGRRPAIEKPDDFFTAIISGSKARATLRSFLQTSTHELHANVLDYLDSVQIERPDRKGAAGIYPIRVLLESLGLRGRDRTNVPPDLAVGLYLSAINGSRPPPAILQAAVRRNKAEAAWDPSVDSQRDKWSRFAARCSLIRICLLRNPNRKEALTVSLDLNNQQPAYLLGRVLAILDAIQRDVSPKVNTTIVDRFYGSASSTPVAVFPTLLRLNQHHLAKLRREKAGLAVVRERLLQDATSGLRSFPRTMTLEAQGLFALGFHHQRQALFAKKDRGAQDAN